MTIEKLKIFINIRDELYDSGSYYAYKIIEHNIIKNTIIDFDFSKSGEHVDFEFKRIFVNNSYYNWSINFFHGKKHIFTIKTINTNNNSPLLIFRKNLW